MYKLKLKFSKLNFRNYSNMNSKKFNIENKNNDITLTPSNGYTSVLIWMHGLGDSALGFKDFFDSPISPLPKAMKVVLLTAPTAPVTINGGMKMTSWYDIRSFDRSEDSIQKSDVIKNSNRVKNVIDEEAKKLGGDYSKIILGGFSQGACMSLHIGLTDDKVYGGLVILSGLLFPFSGTNINSSKKNMPIFIGHGKYDDVIPIMMANFTYQSILSDQTIFNNLVYKSYNEGHTITSDEIQDMKEFLSKF